MRRLKGPAAVRPAGVLWAVHGCSEKGSAPRRRRRLFRVRACFTRMPSWRGRCALSLAQALRYKASRWLRWGVGLLSKEMGERLARQQQRGRLLSGVYKDTRHPCERRDRRRNCKAAQDVPSRSGSRSTEAGPGCNVLNCPAFPRCTFRKLSCKGLFFQSTRVYSYEGE
jgi:hypothetical protein